MHLYRHKVYSFVDLYEIALLIDKFVIKLIYFGRIVLNIIKVKFIVDIAWSLFIINRNSWDDDDDINCLVVKDAYWEYKNSHPMCVPISCPDSSRDFEDDYPGSRLDLAVKGCYNCLPYQTRSIYLLVINPKYETIT